MAEAVLVMTILGIIATIMITTLKPAEFKDKALKVMADKVLGEIDNATTLILLNDSKDGTMENLIAVDGTIFGVTNNASGTRGEKSEQLAKLYKKYHATTRKECKDSNCPCYREEDSSGNQNFSYLYLKDGACVTVGLLEKNRSSCPTDLFVFPGEDWDIV